MRYLSAFNTRFRALRERHRLTQEDVAALIGVDVGLIRRWEETSEAQRCYPNVEQLIDVCIRTGEPLDALLDLEALRAEQGDQLALPGLDEGEEGLDEALDTLISELEQRLPDSRERRMLKAFRECDADRQMLVLQMLGIHEAGPV
ncbi:MAG: XRE family transcriptional regulator [Gammaproteobacteria bacterium]|nr:MAG: XRE family transcriptional regulator [Gammaproteobacteria bacterium]